MPKPSPKPVARPALKSVGGSGVSRTPRAHPAAILSISSRNYSSWSLRGWLLVRFAGLDLQTQVVVPDEQSRRELLLLSPSILVPCLTHEGVRVWDTLAIGEYLNEILPAAGLLPAERAARAHCRAISGEMHAGFASLRSALPMNLRGYFPDFRVWSRAQDDIDRITDIWRDCLTTYGGPYLFGARRTLADAMYAPVCTRFRTYGVALDEACAGYRDTILAMPEMREWREAALQEPEEIDELDMEF